MATGKGKLAAFENLVRFISGGADTPRARYLRTRLQDSDFVARLNAADEIERARLLREAAYQMPDASRPARTIEAPMPGRTLNDEQTIARSVTDEAPYLAGSPPESLRGLHEELISVPDNVPDSLGAVVERINRAAAEAGGPRFSFDTGAPPRFDFGMDALNNPTVRSQADTGPQWGAGWRGSDAPPSQYEAAAQSFVQGPSGYAHRIGVRPSQSGIGSSFMDDAEAAAALLSPPAPRDLGTSLADTGALGPGAQQLFGVPGTARSRQVGTHGGGRVFGDVAGPGADLSVQIAGPGGRAMDVLPGSGVAGDMPVGRAGDVIGPGAMDADVVSPAGRATVDDAVGPAGAWEGRINRRGSQVVGEDVVAAQAGTPANAPPADVPTSPAPRQAPAPVGEAIPDTRMATPEELLEARNAAAELLEARNAAARSRNAAARSRLASAMATAFGIHALQPAPELDEPPMDVAAPDDLVNEAVAAAVDDLMVEDDLDVPQVEFEPIARVAEALPPAGEMLGAIPEEMLAEAIAPEVPLRGEPVGIARSEVPEWRRLKEIRDLLQRGGDEEQIRNNPRYADLDDYQRERAILRGRDLGNRRDRVRMAGILSQGGRLPWGPASAAADRYLRMDPQEQQDFLAAGGFNPMARGPMQDMAARQQHRRRMEEVAALGQNQVNVANAQGEWGVRGAQVGADAQLGVAGINRGVAERGQDANERIAAADRAVKFQELEQQLAVANANLQQAAREGNANRAAAARTEAARINAKMQELRATERQSTAANQARLEAARIANPAALDPLDAVDRAATANATPKLLEIIGKHNTRAAAFAAIRRDPAASMASQAEISRALDRKFPR